MKSASLHGRESRARGRTQEVVSRQERKDACSDGEIPVARAEVLAVCATADAPLEDYKACALWQRLLRGSCTLLDCFDEAGVRYLVLDSSDSVLNLDLSKLSTREREALQLRAQGTSLKLVASELNVSVATASRVVSTARRKLGAVSSVELLCTLDDDKRRRSADGPS